MKMIVLMKLSKTAYFDGLSLLKI